MPVSIQPTAFVTDEGHWSKQSDIVTFNHRALTEHQWWMVAELHDWERLDYILAVLNKQDLTKWEEATE